jgi:hypothetical protein
MISDFAQRERIHNASGKAMMKLFLSHSWQDGELFEQLTRMLSDQYGHAWRNLSFANGETIGAGEEQLHIAHAWIKEIDQKLHFLLNQLRRANQTTRENESRSVTLRSELAKAEHFSTLDGWIKSIEPRRRIEAELLKLTSERESINAEIRDLSAEIEDAKSAVAVKYGIEFDETLSPNFEELSRRWGRDPRASTRHPSFTGQSGEIYATLLARIIDCDIFIALISDNYFYSIWSQTELMISFRLEKPSIFIGRSSSVKYQRHYETVGFNRLEIIQALAKLHSRSNDAAR